VGQAIQLECGDHPNRGKRVAMTIFPTAIPGYNCTMIVKKDKGIGDLVTSN